MTNPPPKPEDKNNPEDKTAVDKALDQISESFNRLAKPKLDTDTVNEFFRAVKNNRPETLRKILATGFDPNIYNNAGQTALHVAAISNAADAARVLIDHGANVRLGQKDNPDHVPLEDAVNWKKPEMAELLAQRGGYVPGTMVDGCSLLYRACEKGNARVVDALLKANADYNETTENGSTPLLIAVKSGNTEIVKLLLQFPSVVQSMNEHYIKTDERKRTAFQVAIDRGRITLVAAMIEKGAEVNYRDSEGNTPLLLAVENGNLNLIRLLVESGADLNTSHKPHGTPLAYACSTETLTDDSVRAQIIDLLLGLGADADIPSHWEQMPPLHLLLQYERTKEPVEALLGYPVNTEAHSNGGDLPLLLAARQGRTDYLQLLLKAGADINGRSMEDARTPLITATLHNKQEAVQTLLQAGANPSLYDGHGKSALSYARERDLKEIIQLLEQALKDKNTTSFPPPQKPGPPFP